MSKTLQNCHSLQKGLSQDREENSDPFPKYGTVLAIAGSISRARLHGYSGREVDAMTVVVRRKGISGLPAVSCRVTRYRNAHTCQATERASATRLLLCTLPRRPSASCHAPPGSDPPLVHVEALYGSTSRSPYAQRPTTLLVHLVVLIRRFVASSHPA